MSGQSTQQGSRSVTSNQEGVHPDLEKTVRKHLTSTFQKPFSEHTQQAFEHMCHWLEGQNKPFILDSGCGVGQSTQRLALENPDCAVVGVDQSAHRLAQRANQRQQGKTLENRLLLQADCVDLWRLIKQNDLEVHKHYLYYPNPWPKKHHLKRRWHGHPVWGDLLAICHRLELRTNWHIYAQEFALALSESGLNPHLIELDAQAPFFTPFEEKYARSGQSLYQVSVKS